MYPKWQTEESEAFRGWTSLCKAQQERYGPDSVLTLIPNLEERKLTRPVRAMVIQHGITTKKDLMDLEPSQIACLKDIGKVTEKLIVAMRNAAIAQKEETLNNPGSDPLL